MAVNYTIGDVLITLKNASSVKKKKVKVLNTKFVRGVLDLLKKHNYIKDYVIVDDARYLEVELNYRKDGEPYIANVKFYSKPGRRWYVRASALGPVRSGHGIMIITTPKGILTSLEAKKENVGGEIICEIW